MSRQLSCRDMCKIVTWFDHSFLSKTNINFDKILIMSSKTFLWNELLLYTSQMPLLGYQFETKDNVHVH